MGEERTHEKHLQHLEAVRTQGDVAKKYYGIERSSLLLTEPKDSSNFPQAFMKDSMHDFLKGTVPMEIKLTLREFVLIKKYFDVDFLNSRIQAFNYGVADKKTKPSANFSQLALSKLSSYVIRQSAAQTWCLLRVFPFLFGN